MSDPIDHSIKSNTPPEYYTKQPITFLPRVLTTLISVLAIVSVIMYMAVGKEAAMYFLIVFGFFVVVGLVLSKITIKVSSGLLILKFGPFKDTLKISEIETVRIVEVSPMGTYLGFGKRFGRDGSIGYIAGGKVGVQVEMNEGKVYVITVDKPHELIGVIRYYQNSSK